LVPTPRVTALEREISRDEGQLGEFAARISQSYGKIAEAELQIQQLDNDQATEIAKDLREAENKITELQERKKTAEDQLNRVDIRAPISGVVHQLAVHTVGGVVAPNEPLMMIVPEKDRLIVDVRISPLDIDQVVVGQAVRVRFSSFNQRLVTPESRGRLFRVSGDISRDPQTGNTYYTGGVSLDETDIGKLTDQGLKLVAGMPAESFIKAGSRTVASYLLRPINDQMQRAMRED
jgi:HlyD family secretion protein